MSKHNKTQQHDSDSNSAGKSPRRRRWPRILGLVLATAATVLAFAPTLVMQTGLRNILLDKATHDLGLQVRCDAASAAWWSPIQLSDITVRDPAGEVVGTAASISTQRSLAQLILATSDLGLVQVDSPVIHCQLRNDGSNLEDLLGAMPTSSEGGKSPKLHLEIQSGRILFSMAESQTSWRVESCNASCDMTNEAIRFHANGQVIASDSAGQFKTTGELSQRTDRAQQTLKVQAKLRELPLGPFTSLASRVGVDVTTVGSVTGVADLSIDPVSRQLSGSLQFQDTSITSPTLKPDTLITERLTADFDLQLTRNQLTIRELIVDSDLLNCVATGVFEMEAGLTSPLALLEQNNYQSRGQVDVARLTQQLRHTLSGRTDTQLSEGLLTWELENATNEASRVVSGHVSTQGFKIVRSNQSIVAAQPIQARFQVTRKAEGWIVDNLTGQSTFLSFSGRGDLQHGQFILRGDLSRLRDELNQFVDLQGTALAGRLDGRMRWQVGADGQLACTGSFNANDLQLSLASGQMLREPSLDITFDTQARLSNQRLSQISAGQLNLAAGNDQLSAELTKAVSIDRLDWPLRLHLTGDLVNWRQRLQGLTNTSLPAVSGRVDSTVAIDAVEDQLRVSVSEANIQELELELAGNRIREPVVQLKGSANWDRSKAMFSVPDASLTCTSLAMRIANLNFNTRAQSVEQGQLSYRGDLARLWQWVPGRNGNYHPTGRISGLVTTSAEMQALRFQAKTDIDEFRWLQKTPLPTTARQQSDWQELWSEPQLQLATSGRFPLDGSSIELAQFSVTSSLASFSTNGQIVDPFGRVDVKLVGQTQVNLDQLSTRLQPTWGDQLRFKGRIAKPFQVTGPLRVAETELHPVSRGDSPAAPWLSSNLKAAGGIGWEQAYAYGFDLGQGSVDMRLQRQNVFVLPIDLAASGGRIRLTPELHVGRHPRLNFAAGKAIEGVQITPQMCRGWLKFIAPLMADVADAQGTFSLDLAEARIPLAHPMGSQITGSLEIHSAQVGPGATSRQLLSLVQQIKSLTRANASADATRSDNWIIVPEQQVGFEMAGERVAHKNLTMIIGGVPIRTRGWVGLDERMSLVATIAIQDEWIGNNRWLSTLKGQTIDVPISGSLKKPRLDQRVLKKLTSKAVSNGAEELLQQELQKQLNRLFER